MVLRDGADSEQMAAWEFQTLQNIAEKNGWHKFVSMQNYYNLIYREEEREMVRLEPSPNRIHLTTNPSTSRSPTAKTRVSASSPGPPSHAAPSHAPGPTAAPSAPQPTTPSADSCTNARTRRTRRSSSVSRKSLRRAMSAWRLLRRRGVSRRA